MAFGSVNTPGRGLLTLRIGHEKLEKMVAELEAADVGASPTGHKHTRSEITDFPTSMPASDVPAWAKAADKPVYTASEVGAAASGHTHTAADVGAKDSGWKPFAVGTSAPSDTTQLWIDTTPDTGGLKYWNGSDWVAVPVMYT